MKILVIQNRMGIGDMIMFLPFVKAISNYYGEQISLMVKKNTKASEYLNEEKYIKEIIYLERSEVESRHVGIKGFFNLCLLYTSPSPRDLSTSRMPSSA